MIKEDYELLKKLADNFSGEFTTDEAGLSEETLLRFSKEGWLHWWSLGCVRHWSVEHPAKEALEEYERILTGERHAENAEKRAVAAERRAKRAEFVSWLAVILTLIGLIPWRWLLTLFSQ